MEKDTDNYSEPDSQTEQMLLDIFFPIDGSNIHISIFLSSLRSVTKKFQNQTENLMTKIYFFYTFQTTGIFHYKKQWEKESYLCFMEEIRALFPSYHSASVHSFHSIILPCSPTFYKRQ